MMKLGDAGSTRPLRHITRCLTVEADNVTYQSSPGLVSGTLHLLTSPHSSMTTRLFSTRIVPDLFFSNPAGAGFCQIWNDKSDRSRIFKLTVILLILVCETLGTYE